MDWHAATDSIMRAATSTMGETVIYVPKSGVPLTLRAIFEDATNFDETVGVADIENFKAMVDFRSSELTEEPRKNDRITIPRTGKSYRIIQVISDGWARHRCLLRDE